MITPEDFYAVMCAMAPLYSAMLLAYAAVRRWHVFTPDQCSGINRFVATFAVPVLSFHFISLNNPYTMDLRFLLADTLSKLLVLALRPPHRLAHHPILGRHVAQHPSHGHPFATSHVRQLYAEPHGPSSSVSVYHMVTEPNPI
ncbi:uncharacterized protein A4U43_UnF11740 [Asparagus officinalis]|uniref:Auxin efflux carrier component n=1 Tax=Asparagus officinalis TaxID=4686 RepID=A0A1R3L578_ASPOF|nr:uncharacterized protein A4U43_UnF11740 [Asparagus officinalis]